MVETMSDNAQHIADFEADIASKEPEIKLREALERLERNSDFKLLINVGYFREEAIRLVDLKSDPAHQTPEKQAHILRQIDSIGELKSYFRKVETHGDNARIDVQKANEMIEHLANGGEYIDA